MAILFLVEIADGKVKKASFEAASYAAKYASQTGKEAVGLALGSIDDASLSALGIYGAKKIIHASNAGFDNLNSLIALFNALQATILTMAPGTP